MSVSPSMKTAHVAAKAAAEPPAVPVSNGNGHDIGNEEIVNRGAMTARKINRPSPSINEALVSEHHAIDPLTRDKIFDPTLSRLIDGVRSAREACERAQRVAEAIFADENKTVASRHRQAKDKVWRLAEPAMQDLDGALGNAKREIERIEAATRLPAKPTDAAGAYLATEIRTRFANMPEKDRMKTIGHALKDKDETVIAAVLTAPAMLSGLTNVEIDALRAQWRTHRWGPEVERINRLKGALSDAQRAGTLSLSFINSLSSDQVVSRAEAAEARVAAALNS